MHYCVHDNLLPAPYPESHQSTPPPPIPNLKHFNIILPATTVSSKLPLSLCFSYQNPVCISLLPHTSHIPCTSHSSWFHHPKSQITKPQNTQFLLHTAKQQVP